MMTKLLWKVADFLTLYVLMLATSIVVFTTVSEGITMAEAVQAAMLTCFIKTGLSKGYHAATHKFHAKRKAKTAPRKTELIPV